MRVIGNCLGPGKRLHLGVLPINVEHGDHGYPKIIAQGFFGVFGIPGAGEHHIHAFAERAQTGAIIIVDEIGVMNQVDQVFCHVDGFVAGLDAGLLIETVFTKEGGAGRRIESGHIPGVRQREGDFGFLQHEIEGVDFLAAEFGFVIVDEPGVGLVGQAIILIVGPLDRVKEAFLGVSLQHRLTLVG